MSESSNIVLFPLPHGVEHDVPVDDRRREEQELQQILRRLTTEMSALAKVKALPRAKLLYESLHPETRHGGDHRPREQDPGSGSWPCFTDHVAATCGISRTTVYTQLKWAERLETLAPEAETEALATSLSNQLGVLARIAALPDAVLQQDLALRFDRQRRVVTRELRNHERDFCIARPTTKKKKEEDQSLADRAVAGTPEVAAGDAQATADGKGTPSVSYEPYSRDTELAAVEAALGASGLGECLDVIRGLQSDRAEVEGLRDNLKHAEGRCANLESYLSLYERSPLGELFEILGVTTVHEALARARSAVGVNDAAE